MSWRHRIALSLTCAGSLRSVLLCAAGIVTLVGCTELAGTQQLPAGTNDPGFYQTRTGAIGLRNTAVYQLENAAIPALVVNAGLLTDELESNLTGVSAGVLLSSSLPAGGSLDERILPEALNGGQGDLSSVNSTYAGLQSTRSSFAQAIAALALYDTTAESPFLRAESYALEGYTEILLADLFCSGVPLSTLDFQKDFTYRASSTTAQVYLDAVTKENSAFALADTSAQIQNLALVLKGRALLALDSAAAAAHVVAAVPDGFQYQLAVSWTPQGSTTSLNPFLCCATVSDQEGVNGLPFISNDPRTAVQILSTSRSKGPPTVALPAKYALSGFSPFTVADWIEARLIQSEAALQAHDTTTWLTLLNHLRETAEAPGQTTPLTDTTDPGSDTARVSLLFHERAYWLFVTGHRQGDLRRLIRQYGRPQDTVYPVGQYFAPGAGQYGSDVTVPIPAGEYANPLFHGCLNRDA